MLRVRTNPWCGRPICGFSRRCTPRARTSSNSGIVGSTCAIASSAASETGVSSTPTAPACEAAPARRSDDASRSLDLDLGATDLEAAVGAELRPRPDPDLDRELEGLAGGRQIRHVEARVADRRDPRLEQRD